MLAINVLVVESLALVPVSWDRAGVVYGEGFEEVMWSSALVPQCPHTPYWCTPWQIYGMSNTCFVYWELNFPSGPYIWTFYACPWRKTYSE